MVWVSLVRTGQVVQAAAGGENGGLSTPETLHQTARFLRKAVTWLAQHLSKPILRWAGVELGVTPAGTAFRCPPPLRPSDPIPLLASLQTLTPNHPPTHRPDLSRATQPV